MKPVVISMCDRTGIMVTPWAQAGCECYCVDIQHSIRKTHSVEVGSGLIHYTWGDCRSWRLPHDVRGRVKIGFAFTPCTDLSVSGARDFVNKSGWALADGLQMFDSVEVAFTFGGFPYMMENPASRLSSHRRKPDFTFQPWEYGDLWYKRTCLWIGNGFIIPRPIHAKPPPGTTEKIFKMPPSDNRDDLRSETPPEFARAVFNANCHIL